MKIMHLCLACFYIDNYSYQENLLPKYHKKMGNDVVIVASTESFDSDGKLTYVEPRTYFNEDGIKVTRLPYRRFFIPLLSKKIRKYKGLNEQLNTYNPDFIFIHGSEFGDTNIVAKYAKNHRVTIVCDCHSDFSNSARSFLTYHLLHKGYYKMCTKRLLPYTKRFYGVLPARVDFLVKVLGVPKEKCSLLVMGVDDELVDNLDSDCKLKVRKKYGIMPSDYLIVTGGKIDLFKKQTFLLMRAVKDLKEYRVKLVVFGSVCPELKEEFNSLCDNETIFYAGWKDLKESYELLSSANLAIYPGRHSVYWEHTVGLGTPLVVKKWENTQHVNVCGNAIFLESDSKELIKDTILKYLFTDDYSFLKAAADKAKKEFLYSRIAKKSLGADN